MGISVSRNHIRQGMRKYPLAGARAWVDQSGGETSRVTGTRVLTGAVVAGPAGAIVGGLARKRKDNRQLFLHVQGDGYRLVEEIKLARSGPGTESANRRTVRKAEKLAAEITSKGAKAARKAER
jgi:hypothetical protein